MLGLVTTVLGVATPNVLAGLDDAKTVGAVRYVSAELQRVRMDAVTRGVNTAMRFSQADGSYICAVYADGNGDGVTSRDIQRGVDTKIQGDQRLPDQFSGVDFGTLPGLPPVDASSSAPGQDPIKFGSSNMAAFTPVGTSSSGSLYILGPHGAQYVIRVLGETGRTRILKFNARTRRWEPL